MQRPNPRSRGFGGRRPPRKFSGFYLEKLTVSLRKKIPRLKFLQSRVHFPSVSHLFSAPSRSLFLLPSSFSSFLPRLSKIFVAFLCGFSTSLFPSSQEISKTSKGNLWKDMQARPGEASKKQATRPKRYQKCEGGKKKTENFSEKNLGGQKFSGNF